MPLSLSAFHAAQVIGIGATTWLSGNIASISLFSATALQRSVDHDSMPTVLAARQWKYTLEQGKPNPPTAVFTAALFAFCAWAKMQQESSNNGGWLYAAASACTFGMIPYTIIWIFPINYRLIEMAGQSLSEDENASASRAEEGSGS
ncbi:hypothetical protein LEL_08741 [Akanthomyces lecanii RCEF 1005]|uniref:Uncharacterized protein n=1 Tax=Akanthomyces lecanii RCEF 1005 TaxID=1081108 RepID=A0A168DSL7_CORDF|nr:hypothetical protein LEL_08741 [Akanthomyces lecanii RCEF 1005]